MEIFFITEPKKGHRVSRLDRFSLLPMHNKQNHRITTSLNNKWTHHSVQRWLTDPCERAERTAENCLGLNSHSTTDNAPSFPWFLADLTHECVMKAVFLISWSILLSNQAGGRCGEDIVFTHSFFISYAQSQQQPAFKCHKHWSMSHKKTHTSHIRAHCWRNTKNAAFNFRI